MADDEWQVVGKKGGNKKPNSSQPAAEKLAEIRAQVAALRAGGSSVSKPVPRKAPVPTHASYTRSPQPQSLQQLQLLPVLRRLNPPSGTETSMQSKLNGDKYYQAFVRVTKDASGNVSVRFHKTDVVVVKASGDIILSTGGWFTTTTMYCMNDLMHMIDVTVRADGNPNDGRWSVTHSSETSVYSDGMVIPPQAASHQHRAQTLLRHALEQGIACFAYFAGPGAAGGGAAVAPSPAAAAAGAVARPAAAGVVGLGSGGGMGGQPAPGPVRAASGVVGAGVGPVGVAPLAQGQAGTGNEAGGATGGASAAAAGGGVKLTAEHFDSYLMDDILDEDTACIACMARTRETIIIPCGHLVLCGECSVGINMCPMCRVPVMDLISLG